MALSFSANKIGWRSFATCMHTVAARLRSVSVSSEVIFSIMNNQVNVYKTSPEVQAQVLCEDESNYPRTFMQSTAYDTVVQAFNRTRPNDLEFTPNALVRFRCCSTGNWSPAN